MSCNTLPFARPSVALICAAIAVCRIFGGSATAQVVDPYYEDQYWTVDLGSVPGLPAPYGGLCFSQDDPDILLIGGNSESGSGAIYAVELDRDCYGQIAGFIGEATLFASAPFITGGLCYGPDNVLFYTTYSTNTLGQIKPGSVEADKIIDLAAMGIASSSAAMMVVPDGFAGAGRLKIASCSAGYWYDMAITPDGSGTFDIVDVVNVAALGGCPEGIVYIADYNPKFDAESVLVSRWSIGDVVACEIDANGDPLMDTLRPFIAGLSGAMGAAIDPETGQFFFSTWGGGDHLVLVKGFTTPCPADVHPNGGDGVVNIDDLFSVLGAWGQICVPQDINRDETVNIDDLFEVLGHWGPCPQ